MLLRNGKNVPNLVFYDSFSIVGFWTTVTPVWMSAMRRNLTGCFFCNQLFTPSNLPGVVQYSHDATSRDHQGNVADIVYNVGGDDY